MAAQSIHDVVNQSLSVGDHSPSDASATQNNNYISGGEEGEVQGAGRRNDGTSSLTIHSPYGSEVSNGIATTNGLVKVSIRNLCLHSWASNCSRAPVPSPPILM